MTEKERESAIHRLACLMADCMDHAEKFSNDYFFWRGEADRLRLQMEALIRSRSREQVFLMEAQRGLV